MITICIIFLLALIFALFALAITGILYVFWPVAIVLGIGLILDILAIKSIFKRRSE